MSSDSDEEDFVIYGTPLEPLEEDAVPKKRAITVEDQVAKDKHGRRRFHGAFTGGYSAGFFNTVGSLEGWKPSQFKSSRSSKTQTQQQRPEDFMDDEDMDEFGIAPKTIRPTSNYNMTNDGSTRKRGMAQVPDGPIPGLPVLSSLIEPVRETIGMRLLGKMGWRPGQGVGPRQSAQEKLHRKKLQKPKRVYGCSLPGQEENSIKEEEQSGEEDFDTELTFAPDDFDPYIYKPKNDCFGLGYSGLSRRPVLSSHMDLLGPANSSLLVTKEKTKKVNIRGQAFGVGAFEEEDADIYAKEDMSQYDFALDTPQMLAEKRQKQRIAQLALPSSSSDILDGFVASTIPVMRKQYPPPPLPAGFIPNHQIRQSRFSGTTNTANIKAVNPQLSASERATIVNSSQETEKLKIPEAKTAVTNLRTFRPFVADPDKQERYEKFLTFSKSQQADMLKNIQPLSMAEWEQERERAEFEQAAKMYRPLSAVFSDRFVSASQPDDTSDPLAPVARTSSADGDLRNAAKLKMFGHMTRKVSEWEPHSILCKRFNIPQPGRTSNRSMINKTSRPKFSVFNFLEAASYNETHSSNVDTLSENSNMTSSTSGNIIPPEPPISGAATTDDTATSSMTIKAPLINKEVEPAKDDSVEKLADATSKIDLYKAIFLSSSDESDQEETLEVKVHKEPTAAEQNTLRNTSPPQGIFANLNFDSLNTKETKSVMPKENTANDINIIRNRSPSKGSYSNLNLDGFNPSTEETKSETLQIENPATKLNISQSSPSRGSFFANLTFDVSNNSDAVFHTEKNKSSELVENYQNKKEWLSSTPNPDDIGVYGPALPKASHIVDRKNPVSKVHHKFSDSEEDWVELNDSTDSGCESNKQRRKKKQKKESHRKPKKQKEKRHKHKKKKK